MLSQRDRQWAVVAPLIAADTSLPLPYAPRSGARRTERALWRAPSSVPLRLGEDVVADGGLDRYPVLEGAVPLAVAAKAFPVFPQRGAAPAPIGRSRTPFGTSHPGVIVLSGMRAGSKETICALAQLSTQRSLLGAPREGGDPWRGVDPAHHVHLKKSSFHRFGQNVAGRSRWDQRPADFAQTAIRGLGPSPQKFSMISNGAMHSCLPLWVNCYVSTAFMRRPECLRSLQKFVRRATGQGANCGHTGPLFDERELG